MTAYFIRRLLLIVPTFIGITILVFVITRFVPGVLVISAILQLLGNILSDICVAIVDPRVQFR